MRITERSHYGLRAMICLAQHSPGRPMSAREISAREGIPPRYLEQVLNRLKNGRLIMGHRGPGGGYVLARDASEISARDILAVVEDSDGGRGGFLAEIECAAARGPDGAKVCGPGCLSKRVWVTLAAKVDEVLSQFRLADLVAGAGGAEDVGE
ncbi:MAG TPA: Rrf2 family transcriptional regulator [Armatimonadota bacterium]|nr:Rrf2 family transcriptional regulator [Armatimonadota bacterium]